MFKKSKYFKTSKFYQMHEILSLIIISMYGLIFCSCQNVAIDPETARAQTNVDKVDTIKKIIKPEVIECKMVTSYFFKLDTIDLTKYTVMEEINFDTSYNGGAKFTMKGVTIFPDNKFKFSFGKIGIRWKELNFYFKNSWIRQLQDTIPNTSLFEIDSLYTSPSPDFAGSSFSYYITDTQDNTYPEELRRADAGEIVNRSYVSNVYLSSNLHEKRNRILNLKMIARFYIPSAVDAIHIYIPITMKIKY